MSTVVKTKNETFWFCLVLLVEVFGLSVALGGPWLEVLYFLAIVISQTIAGAYVLARLRKEELQLPIPELLAMGFSIGSSSAAISQLILRDLLGIRLMLSPYVPIIAVATWLLVRRSPKLDVEITHTDSTTLLWLLFPAPLAMSQSSFLTFSLYVIPLLIFCSLLNSNFRFNFKIIATPIVIAAISVPLAIVNAKFSKIGSGISRLISDDIRFDLAQAIGTAKWGINSNIEFANQIYSYYKISYLWLGPLATPLGIKAIDIIDNIVAIFLLSIIGFAVWSLALKLTKKPAIANLSAVLVFIGTAFPDTVQINLRFLHLLGYLFLLTVPILFLNLPCKKKIFGNLTLIVGGFIVAGTRFSFIYQIFPFVLISQQYSKLSFKKLSAIILNLSFFVIGIFFALAIFSYKEGSTVYNYLVLHASAWPISPLESVNFLVISSILLLLPFLLSLQEDQHGLRKRGLLSLMILFISQLFVPHLFIRDADFLLPFVFITSPFVAASLLKIKAEFGSKFFKSNIIFRILFVLVLGIFYRISYDVFIRLPNSNRRIGVLLYQFSSHDLLLNGGYIFFAVLLTLIFLKTSREKFLVSSNRLFLGTLFCMNSGLFISTVLNPLTDSIVNNEQLTQNEDPPMVKRWKDPERIEALRHAKTLSKRDDIFASNFGLFRESGYFDDYRIQLMVEKQFYLMGRYSYLYQNFQAIFSFNFVDRMPGTKYAEFSRELSIRFSTSIDFPFQPTYELLKNMRDQNVKWFVVDLERTELRDWEPWAKTRFINDKVAILELATDIVG